MQALWLTFDDIAGKGISLSFILKFLFYTGLLTIPQALPIGVLLSSIMALGNFSEHYEFAATKSAGISLQRIMRPLIVLTIFFSAVNFFFLNNVYPYAIFKQKNLYINIKKKKPSMALIPGSFNTEIPNYQIKFNEKYGEEDNLLKDVLIYDLTSRKGNQKVITAERGKIVNEEGSKYMTLILYDGYYYEEHIRNNTPYKRRQKMPSSNATFKEYEFNIDISSLVNDNDLNKENFKNSHNMLSLNQLKDTLPTLKLALDDRYNNRAKNIYSTSNAKKLHQNKDTMQLKGLNPEIIQNFDLKGQHAILNNAFSKVSRAYKNFENNRETLKFNRKKLNLYDVEFYNRIALSFSCLILFFIGAPLGSIIRKGGMGLPMILAICIYVVYHFSNTFGRNLAEESSITALVGAWVSTAIMLPFGILLTRRATRDKGLFSIDTLLAPITNTIKKFTKQKNNDNTN